MDEHLRKHGMISWSELMTNDLTAAKNFYSELFGWNFEQACTSEMDYTIVKSNDREIAGMMALPPEDAKAPPSWGTYVTVDDVDATASKAEKLGAKIVVPPQDIPQVGRFCVLRDPQGAFIAAITYVQP
jgi:predicted enzyme related to lactoylglutathione lyase